LEGPLVPDLLPGTLGWDLYVVIGWPGRSGGTAGLSLTNLVYVIVAYHYTGMVKDWTEGSLMLASKAHKHGNGNIVRTTRVVNRIKTNKKREKKRVWWAPGFRIEKESKLGSRHLIPLSFCIYDSRMIVRDSFYNVVQG
jgi:hypothetical protein